MFLILYCYYYYYYMPAEPNRSSSCLFWRGVTTRGQLALGWGGAQPSRVVWGSHSCDAPAMKGCMH